MMEMETLIRGAVDDFEALLLRSTLAYQQSIEQATLDYGHALERATLYYEQRLTGAFGCGGPTVIVQVFQEPMRRNHRK
jgi:hypothetical protein